MQAAVKLTVTIPESRTVELKLPKDVPLGTAEVIVLLLSPEQARPTKYPQDALRGTVRIIGDVLEPVLPTSEWAAERSELE